MFSRHSYGDFVDSCDEHDDSIDAYSFFSLSANIYYKLNLPESISPFLSSSLPANHCFIVFTIFQGNRPVLPDLGIKVGM